MSAPAQFRIREIVRLSLGSLGPSIVFAGDIVDGIILPCMDIQFELQEGLYCSCSIEGVEYINRVSVGESLVGLRCKEVSANDAGFYDELCPPGTVVNIVEGRN